MKTTLISHFYNEEFLLPFWLKHHAKLFDHGIMIDYDSTDNSVDIIKHYVPHWEIRRSKNDEFHAQKVDQEIMDIESELSGWKMCLNTTEFLLLKNLPEYISTLKHLAVRTTGVVIVDTLKEKYIPIDPNKQIYLQRFHGYLESDLNQHSRSRFLHRAEHGFYMMGRHHSYKLPATQDNTLFLAWFGWSPIDVFIRRKLQIQERWPKDPEYKKIQPYILETYESWEKHYLQIEPLAYNLLEKVKGYKDAIGEIQS